MVDAKLIKAISRIATQYIGNTTGETQLGWVARINDYSGRILRDAHPIVAPADAPADPDNPESDPFGPFDPTFGYSKAQFAALRALLVQYGVLQEVNGGFYATDADLSVLPSDLNQLACGIYKQFGDPLNPAAGADYSRYSGVATRQSVNGTEIHNFVNGVEVP